MEKDKVVVMDMVISRELVTWQRWQWPFEVLLIVSIDCCQIIVISASCFTCYINIDSMQFLLLYGGSLLGFIK